MRAQCFSAPVQRRYYTSTGSAAHLVSLALTLVVVVVPLFLAHNSRGFWPTTSTYTEQPLVKLTYQVVVVLEGERSTDSGARSYFRVITTSLSPAVQRLFEKETRASRTRIYETDSNRDGRPESLHVRTSTPLERGEVIHQVKALAFANYTLQDYSKVNMDVVAVVAQSSPLPAMALSVDGDLRLEMNTPAHITTKMQYPYAVKPLLNVSQRTSPRDLDLHAIVSAFRARPWHTVFEVPYPLWTTDVGARAEPSRQRTFDLDMTIRIPPTTVTYRPTWAELFKTAWIQYFSLVVIVYAFTHGISAVLFQKRILDTYSILDDPQVLVKKNQ